MESLNPALEEKLVKIAALLSERERITKELYALIGGELVEVAVPPPARKRGRPAGIKERNPRERIAVKMDDEKIRAMLHEHYFKKAGAGDLQRKYGISNAYFYRLKEEFKSNNSELVHQWVTEGSSSVATTSESAGEERLKKGICKYCQLPAPGTHTVCEECHSKTNQQAYDNRIIENVPEEDIKKIVILDVVDRIPVSEICKRFKINLRTFAILTKKFRDENPDFMENLKSADPAKKIWGGVNMTP
jgi:hypothetical protein